MSAPSPAKHPARTPRLLQIGLAVLITGAVLSAAAAVGPIWLVRAGVALAIIAGAAAVFLLVGELTAERRRHAARLLQQIREHGTALTTERGRNADVVDVLTRRATGATEELDRERGKNRRLGGRIAELSGVNASLRGELAGRDLTVAGLREALRSRDTEIQLLRADLELEEVAEPTAEVQGLPRRRDTDGAATTDAATPHTGETVIDLPAGAPVLPNYEPDQRKHA